MIDTSEQSAPIVDASPPPEVKLAPFPVSTGFNPESGQPGDKPLSLPEVAPPGFSFDAQEKPIPLVPPTTLPEFSPPSPKPLTSEEKYGSRVDALGDIRTPREKIRQAVAKGFSGVSRKLEKLEKLERGGVFNPTSKDRIKPPVKSELENRVLLEVRQDIDDYNNEHPQDQLSDDIVKLYETYYGTYSPHVNEGIMQDMLNKVRDFFAETNPTFTPPQTKDEANLFRLIVDIIDPEQTHFDQKYQPQPPNQDPRTEVTNEKAGKFFDQIERFEIWHQQKQ